MAGQTGKVRRRMTDQDRKRMEQLELSEVEAASRLREGQGLLRRRQKPIDMRFTTTQPTVKGLEKDWDRLPATPNPRVSLRRKASGLAFAPELRRITGEKSGPIRDHQLQREIEKAKVPRKRWQDNLDPSTWAEELERILKGVR